MSDTETTETTETTREVGVTPRPAESLPRSVPIKSAMIFAGLCYLGGIVVGVRVAQMMKSPCPCEETPEQTATDVAAASANLNGSEPVTAEAETGAGSVGTPG